LSVQLSHVLCAEALTTEDAFDLLREEWDQLVDVSDQRVFFLRFSWNRLWWRSYAPPGSNLLLITCRDEQGRLVGLAPFYRRQLRTAGIPHVREVLFLGTGVFTETSQFLDIVARRGYERLVAETVAGFLNLRDDWDRLWLSTVPAASTVLPHFLEAFGGEVHTEILDRSHIVDTSTDWVTLLGTLGKSTRRNVLRSLRRVTEEYEVEFRLVQTEEELEPALDALVRLHQARWRSLGEPGSFALTGFESFLRAAARASLAEGRLRLWTLSLDGRIAAAKVSFYENGIVYGFQQGFDPAHLRDALGRVVSALCIKACVEDARINAFDFMGGTNQYKDTWTRIGRDSVSLTWLRPGLRSRVFAVIERSKAGAKSVARRLVPGMLKHAVHRILHKRHYSASE
jgi:CelD/BcsL family acetyltransferase involved in cellulose biosynthesis